MKSTTIFLLLFSLAGLNVQAQQALEATVFHQAIGKKSNQQLVDVRTVREFNGGHINGAINFDIRSKTFRTDIDKLDKTKPVFVYCLSGGRSAGAARQMQQMGFSEIYDLRGGMIAWKNANLPVETINGGDSKQPGLSLAQYKSKLKTDKPVLVNFFAPWCGPCRKMAPMLDAFKKKYGDKFTYIKLNADNNEELRKSIQVTEIPTFFVYKNGKSTWKHTGLVEEEMLRRELGL